MMHSDFLPTAANNRAFIVVASVPFPRRQNNGRVHRGGPAEGQWHVMGKVEIRPGVWMAYEDHWCGEPWTVPQTVVMIHGNSESSCAWTCWVPHLARHYRVVRPDLPGFGASPEPADSAGSCAVSARRPAPPSMAGAPRNWPVTSGAFSTPSTSRTAI